MWLSKRDFISQSVGLIVAGSGGLLTVRQARAAGLEPTANMDLGPFYPVEKPMESDADLTRLAGHKQRAKGEILELTGRVLAKDGKPIPHARVEIWQANAAGRYAHHGDTHDVPLDENFQGYGVQLTDAEGRYRFLTIKPANYTAGDFVRSRHIHFDIEGKWDRLVTQMYFPGETNYKQDKVLMHDMEGHTEPLPENIFGKMFAGASTYEPGATLCKFDIVLKNG